MYKGEKMPIISGNLRAKLYRLGISVTQASEEMGFSNAYLSMCFKRGWVTDYAAKIIEDRYGIRYEEYAKIDQPQERHPVADDGTLDLILEELRTIRATLQVLCTR